MIDKFIRTNPHLNSTYQIIIDCPSLYFSAAHFLVLKETREGLHGHNYRVRLRAQKNQLQEDMVFDFHPLKELMKENCQRLDQKLLLPSECPGMVARDSADGANWEITLADGHFSFPKKDLYLLPYQNITAERLAHYLALQLDKSLLERYQFQFDQLEVTVEEAPGLFASYTLR
ncbi:MAG: 6-carboxytetrahydropterin synthase [Pseudomonadota bacterium]